MNTEIQSFPEKSRSDIIDTVAQYRDEVRAFKWLLVLLFLTAAYEFGPELVAKIAVSGIEIREPEVRATFKPMSPKRISRVIHELTRLQVSFPIVRSSIRTEIAGLESLRELRPEKTPIAQREKLLAENLERLWIFFTQPTWEDPSIFEAVEKEIQAVMTLMKRKLPESGELPPLPVSNSRLPLIELAGRDIFAYETEPADAK